MKKFWNFTNEEETGRTLELCGVIAEESCFDDDITPALFKEELFSDTGPVTVWINSPGGDCVAASRIYTMLMDYMYDVTVKIDGIAASAASVIAMAGTEVLMSPTSMMMIHNPMTIACGDRFEMEKAIDMLSEVKESIINAYQIKTGIQRARLARLMDEETWMNAGKAKELGFSDGTLYADGNKSIENTNGFMYSASLTQKALVNKINAKVIKPHKSKPPDGRSVDELKQQLYKSLL